MSKHFNRIIYHTAVTYKSAILTWKFSVAVFNLIEGVDVQAIEEKIKQYQKENAEQIIVNQARKVFQL